ncbi:hypothetical protein [Lacticaseibacillus sharpeae]|uniref:Uncharacterized protein n=1 Tax=Lacticaseibacillus sharpeae JCM 1186 = DSM 20505 TaxID=1291052 RepID=A0A0R1ZK94_9LACO|nr:hypothetical protein [Lacticaseibacillus sharpeae]KRM54754.1 hypothetical protein FC18_GL002168 [Lacticaseibacillus sharpeae JCM 1186 = DSM 20505]
MAEQMTRKQYRMQQEQAEQEAAARDKKRVAVEREYARETAKHPEKTQRFDEVSYRKVSGLKSKLNWAIGIEVILLIIVALVLFLL